MEDEKGRAIRNDHSSVAPFRGPTVPDRDLEEWTEALRSDDIVEVLEALVWLGGRHKLSTDEWEGDVAGEESVAQSKLFEAVLG